MSLSFIDAVSLAGFLVSLQNLDENLSQNDKQDLQKDLADKADKLLQEIHAHLEQQDKKLDKLLKMVGEKNGT